MSFFKSSKMEENIVKLKQQILELTEMIQRNESVIEKLQNELVRSQTTSEESSFKRKEAENLLNIRLNNLEGLIINLEKRINSSIERINLQKDELSSTTQSNFEERINNEISTLNNSQKDLRTKISTLSQALDLLGDGVEDLSQIMNQQISSRTKDRDKEEKKSDLSKQSKSEIISTIKNEQKELFDKFSEIVNQFNTKFSEELTDTVHTLQDSHDRILSELGDHYMPKTIGYELQQLLNDFSSEFKFETQNLRVQIANIKFYQRELLQFRHEIQTMIDNRVNEKFNAISSLLSMVTTKTEEISLYLKNSNVQVKRPEEKLEEIENNQKHFTI